MHIISSFTDYYDCIQRVAQDRSLVYIRNPEVIEVKSTTWFDSTKTDLDYRIITICFCGKRYVCLKMTYDGKTAFCYNIDTVDKFVNEFCDEKYLLIYNSPKGKNYFFNKNVRRNHLIEIFKKADEKRLESGNCCFEAPITVEYTENGIKFTIKNGSLKKIEFYRLFNPIAAFQELSMYLGGLAAPQEKVPEISNADKISARGFDNYSFRKDKSK